MRSHCAYVCAVVVLLVFLPMVAHAKREKLREFTIDLSDPPRERWTPMLQEYLATPKLKECMLTTIQNFGIVVPNLVTKNKWNQIYEKELEAGDKWQNLFRFNNTQENSEYIEEILGITEVLNKANSRFGLREIVGFHLYFSTFQFMLESILSPQQKASVGKSGVCSTIIATDAKTNLPIVGHTFDWPFEALGKMGGNLRGCQSLVHFVRTITASNSTTIVDVSRSKGKGGKIKTVTTTTTEMESEVKVVPMFDAWQFPGLVGTFFAFRNYSSLAETPSHKQHQKNAKQIVKEMKGHLRGPTRINKVTGNYKVNWKNAADDGAMTALFITANSRVPYPHGSVFPPVEVPEDDPYQLYTDAMLNTGMLPLTLLRYTIERARTYEAAQTLLSTTLLNGWMYYGLSGPRPGLGSIVARDPLPPCEVVDDDDDADDGGKGNNGNGKGNNGNGKGNNGNGKGNNGNGKGHNKKVSKPKSNNGNAFGLANGNNGKGNAYGNTKATVKSIECSSNPSIVLMTRSLVPPTGNGNSASQNNSNYACIRDNHEDCFLFVANDDWFDEATYFNDRDTKARAAHELIEKHGFLNVTTEGAVDESGELLVDGSSTLSIDVIDQLLYSLPLLNKATMMTAVVSFDTDGKKVRFKHKRNFFDDQLQTMSSAIWAARCMPPPHPLFPDQCLTCFDVVCPNNYVCEEPYGNCVEKQA